METEVMFSEICRIVREAGDLIRSCTSAGELKAKEGSANFVTRYDSMVQKFLIEKLSALSPEAAFVGEEDGYSKKRIANGYTFIIDPIDGTTNFICGFMASGISVGLSAHGEMEIGVVYNPFREELFAARRGGGAYLNERRIECLYHPLKEGVFCMDTAPYNPELRDAAFEELRKISYLCMDMRSIGSAALSICYVACGRSVAYLQRGERTDGEGAEPVKDDALRKSGGHGQPYISGCAAGASLGEIHEGQSRYRPCSKGAG